MRSSNAQAKGPTIILNSGSLNNESLSKPDKFGRYSTSYVVGIGNRSFRELGRICKELCEQQGLKNPKLPWRIDERTNMVSVNASSKKPVPVVDSNGKKADTKLASDGEFCKLNLTPAVYKIEEMSSYVDPDGIRHPIVNVKEGVNLYLNGVQLVSNVTTEELFG